MDSGNAAPSNQRTPGRMGNDGRQTAPEPDFSEICGNEVNSCEVTVATVLATRRKR
jgi:hypothetical protein